MWFFNRKKKSPENEVEELKPRQPKKYSKPLVKKKQYAVECDIMYKDSVIGRYTFTAIAYSTHRAARDIQSNVTIKPTKVRSI